MKPKIDEGNFLEVVNKQIKKGEHVEYLEDMKKDYEKYKRFFESIFSDKNEENDIYTFRATYLLKKSVWREFELVGDMTFDDLAEAIIESMDWDNDHMHGFELPDPEEKPNRKFAQSQYEFFCEYWEDDPHPYFKTSEIRISDIDYKKVPKMKFNFDYGDGHRFDIEFKGARKVKDNSMWNEFPVLVDQRGVAPEQYPGWDEESEEE